MDNATLAILLTWFFFGLLCGAVCGAIASTKGRDGMGWFFLGLFFGPLAVLVVAAVSNENPPAEPVTEAAASAVVASVAPTGVADELSKLADLLDRGHLSSDEFEAQKKKLLT
ncbi:MAG: SHOCT domain-containing protein [Pseudomonadota bacterium]|jgi:1,4-dihydroxy-2-naphthoate octaprenyltransferase